MRSKAPTHEQRCEKEKHCWLLLLFFLFKQTTCSCVVRKRLLKLLLTLRLMQKEGINVVAQSVVRPLAIILCTIVFAIANNNACQWQQQKSQKKH